jgi:ABC-type branched-subunit amino acid transport system substrate-binding protein
MKPSFLLAFLLTAAAAAPATEITLAQIDWSRGALPAEAAAAFAGAKACIAQANAAGGLRGRPLRLVQASAENATEPPQEFFARVVKQHKPVAVLNLTGTDFVRGLLQSQVLYALSVPVVGVSPGAESLRSPWNPYVFHVRAGDRAQVERMLAHVSTLGIARASVAFEDNEFGRDALRHVEQLASQHGVALLRKIAVPPTATQLTEPARQAAESGAQVHLLLLRAEAGGPFLAALRARGQTAPVYGMSYLSGAEGLQGGAGAAGAHLALAQTTPNPATAATPLTRTYLQAMKQYGPPEHLPSSESLAGCIAARTVIEALARAGGDATPARLVSQLWALRVDLGGYALDLTGSNVGSYHVDIGWVDGSGRLRF